MDQQQLIDSEWFDFCEVCGRIEPANENGHSLCQECWTALELERAKRIGIPASADATEDDILDLLEDHHRICQFLTIVWNDCLHREHQPTVQVGRSICPWDALGAEKIPAEEIEQTAVKIMLDEEFSEAIHDEMSSMFSEHIMSSTWETDPRYDTGQQCVTKGVWPAVTRDEIYNKVAALLWERWMQFLPYKVVTDGDE